MSWDMTVVYKDTKKPVYIDKPHTLQGGTYIPFGTPELWLNITYNYSPFYRKIINDGLDYFNGMEIKESIPILQKIADNLGDDVSNDYWKPTEGNAKKAILDLLELAKLAPDSTIWEVS